VRWALDANPENVPDGTVDANAGFLRPDAYLGVILITNEDDCSVPDDSDLIDASQTHMSDPYGPLWSFRCNEFGHLCNINGTLQHPVRGVNNDLTGCVSDDTATGKETRIADEIAFLKSLKSDPNQILVAAITGPVTPYSVAMRDVTLADGNTEPQPSTVHSCTENSGEYADPSVRIQQWVEGFGDNGLLLPICADSFEPALTRIAKVIGQHLGPACIPETIRNNPAGIPICALNDRYRNQTSMNTVETPIAACASDGNTPPCWSLDDDADKCPGGKLLNVNRGGAVLPSNVDIDVSCELCQPGVPEPGCP
jgi:hypothetical protein